tara:strand:- start:7452 stop:7637 length:186 start_codon:yes stop_codon:yes gene_type:complete
MMPDITKYSSVSISKTAYKELNLIKEKLSDDLGVSFSLAKLIEHLAKEKVKKLKLNGHSGK